VTGTGEERGGRKGEEKGMREGKGRRGVKGGGKGRKWAWRSATKGV